jgi:hypothetical protein
MSGAAPALTACRCFQIDITNRPIRLTLKTHSVFHLVIQE